MELLEYNDLFIEIKKTNDLGHFLQIREIIETCQKIYSTLYENNNNRLLGDITDEKVSLNGLIEIIDKSRPFLNVRLSNASKLIIYKYYKHCYSATKDSRKINQEKRIKLEAEYKDLSCGTFYFGDTASRI